MVSSIFLGEDRLDECGGGGSREAPASPHTRFYLRRYADSISRNCIFVGGFLNGLPVI